MFNNHLDFDETESKSAAFHTFDNDYEPVNSFWDKFDPQLNENNSFSSNSSEDQLEETSSEFFLKLPIWPPNFNPKSPKRSSSATQRQFFKPLIFQFSDFCRDNSVHSFLKNDNLLHKQIALIILRRKLNICSGELPDTHAALDHALLALPVLDFLGNSKRIEENNKFVFKHALKLLKRHFSSERGKKTTKQELESSFLKHYFAKGDGSLSLEPREASLISGALPGSKPLSHTFFSSVFASEKFRRDFEKIVGEPGSDNSPFVKNYLGSIHKKLQKLFRRWQGNIREEGPGPELTAVLLQYFQKNKQCKLPWTMLELKAAVKCFQKTIANLKEPKENTNLAGQFEPGN